MSQNERSDEQEHSSMTSTIITDRVLQWCQSEDSVTSLLASDPSLSPSDAWVKLYNDHVQCSGRRVDEHTRKDSKISITDDPLSRARECGKWCGNEPSELFLQIYHDALCTLDDNPGRAMVTLMGRSGTVPLTVLSVVPDIVRHMSNLIVRAETEVFLATNFWSSGIATKYITDAILELSRRAAVRGKHVVMKIMYDRGNPRQFIDPHHIVPEKDYVGGAVKLPAAKDIPFVDLEVMNYHQPVLGTFHAKYMVVDRRTAVIQSNNIQETDNLEMMVHVEGPIVDSLYDMALISWHKVLKPPLPCLRSSSSSSKMTEYALPQSTKFSEHGCIKGHAAIVDPDKMPSRAPYGKAAVQERPNNSTQSTGTAIVGNTGALESQARVPYKELPEHTTENPHYDDDIAGEVSRVQAAVSSKPDETAMHAVTRHLNHTINVGFPGNAPECDPVDEMTPYIPLPEHEPFPMALVCRPPFGPPTHSSVVNPQNEAWLSALRNAKRNVFIQTPTLNARPLIPAIVAACERGVDVYCYICLGYNDAGELLPMQGGHNDKVVNQMYTTLSPRGRQHLKWYWYVAKDQTKPVHAGKKKRSCHVKLLIVDEHVAIQGNGNQDTQSWYHSQEINLMYDSPKVCRAWIEALRRNQNTGRYGAVSQEDGVWRDELGNTADGAMGPDSGHFAWAKGVIGAVKRVQGTGGF
ncbi:IQ calmodulin-binding motif protein [Xylariaceae sp. FL1272]|nr:IQ calmodulin-binding motif protein [Xylariaceae sp. FL1272]